MTFRGRHGEIADLRKPSREKLAKDVEAYLAKGGEITQLGNINSGQWETHHLKGKHKGKKRSLIINPENKKSWD